MLAERIDSIDAKANSVVTLAAPLDLTAALSRARDVDQKSMSAAANRERDDAGGAIAHALGRPGHHYFAVITAGFKK